MTALVPRPALVLGWAGVLPFAGLTACRVLRLGLPFDPTPALLGYAAAILSFMAGVQWGFTVRAPDGSWAGWRGYAVSVLPALTAWLALLLPPRPGLVVLATGFAALLAYDLWTVRHGYAPDWYGRLRLRLTAAVVALLAAAALA